MVNTRKEQSSQRPKNALTAAEPIKPRSTLNMRPINQSIQMALFRRSSDGVPRIYKLGEKIVRLALEGDRDMIKLAKEAMDGKAPIVTESGTEVPENLGAALISTLIEQLVAQKRNGSDALDVTSKVEQMVVQKRE